MIGIDLGPLLDTVATPGEANPRLRVEPAATPGVFRLEINPAVRGGLDVSTRVRVEALPPGSAVRYVYTLDTADGEHKTIEDHIAAMPADATLADATLEVSATMEAQLLVQPGPYQLTLTPRDARSPLLSPVRSTVGVARVRFLPQIPLERHPRR